MLYLTINIMKGETDPMNSAELDKYISMVAAGDMAALESVYNMTRASVYSFALSMLKNKYDAEDVLHDCYINIYKGAAGYKSSGKPMAWVITIAKNLCNAKLNAATKNASLTDDEQDEETYIAGGLSPEDALILKDLLSGISDEERKIVVLHAVAGLKHREIADILAIPISTVLSKYSRAIKKLQNA